jgi:hypothetical protein
MTQITAANVVSSTTNINDFRDFEYGLVAASNASNAGATSRGAYLFTGNNDVIRYEGDGNENYNTFKTFNIKVVLTGNNSVNVPRMTDLRAIAMQV